MHIRDTYRRRQPHHAVRTVHHWSPVVGGCIHSMSEQRWQHFHDAALSRQCDTMRRSIMSIATRLGDWSGRGYVGDQAEAGGACSSEHCSCWSHAELRHPFAKCPSLGTRSPVQASIPGGYVAAVRQCRRPRSRALGRDQWQPMGGCHDHRRCLHRSRIYVYRPCFYYSSCGRAMNCLHDVP